MKTDPAIEEIRAARIAISREHGNDPKRLVAFYLEYQKRFADRMISVGGRQGPEEQLESSHEAPRPASR